MTVPFRYDRGPEKLLERYSTLLSHSSQPFLPSRLQCLHELAIVLAVHVTHGYLSYPTILYTCSCSLRYLVGFLGVLGIVLLVFEAPSLILASTGYFGLSGFFTANVLILSPCVWVLWRRESLRGELDDKLGWRRQEEALERYVREMKSENVEN